MVMTPAMLVADMLTAAATAPREADEVVGKVAERVADAQRSMVPVDTGRTRDSISAERVEPGVWVVGPETPYSVPLEYGTARTPPQPFVGPAADQHEDAFVEAIVEVGDF